MTEPTRPRTIRLTETELRVITHEAAQEATNTGNTIHTFTTSDNFVVS